MPPIPPPPAEALTWCIGCGFNLHTVPADGSCPECGLFVDRSLKKLNQLRRETWSLPPSKVAPLVQRLGGALLLEVTGLILGTLTIASSEQALALTQSSPALTLPLTPPTVVLLATAIVIYAGGLTLWAITVIRNGGQGFSSSKRRVQCFTLWLQVAAAVGLLLITAFDVLQGGLTPAAWERISTAAGVLLVCRLVQVLIITRPVSLQLQMHRMRRGAALWQATVLLPTLLFALILLMGWSNMWDFKRSSASGEVVGFALAWHTLFGLFFGLSLLLIAHRLRIAASTLR